MQCYLDVVHINLTTPQVIPKCTCLGKMVKFTDTWSDIMTFNNIHCAIKHYNNLTIFTA